MSLPTFQKINKKKHRKYTGYLNVIVLLTLDSHFNLLHALICSYLNVRCLQLLSIPSSDNILFDNIFGLNLIY